MNEKQNCFLKNRRVKKEAVLCCLIYSGKKKSRSQIIVSHTCVIPHSSYILYKCRHKSRSGLNGVRCWRAFSVSTLRVSAEKKKLLVKLCCGFYASEQYNCQTGSWMSRWSHMRSKTLHTAVYIETVHCCKNWTDSSPYRPSNDTE